MTGVLWLWCLGSAAVACVLLRRPPRLPIGNALVLLITIAALAIALTTGFLAVTLHTYAALTTETPVATVTCEPLPGTSRVFEVRYTPSSPAAAREERFTLQGDQWMVSGEFLVWHPWLRLLGFQPVHKPTRISGRFVRTLDELTHPATAHDLNGGTSQAWLWLYRVREQLPFIETVFGDGVYMPAEPGRTYTIYATPTGYLAR